MNSGDEVLQSLFHTGEMVQIRSPLCIDNSQGLELQFCEEKEGEKRCYVLFGSGHLPEFMHLGRTSPELSCACIKDPSRLTFDAVVCPKLEHMEVQDVREIRDDGGELARREYDVKWFGYRDATLILERQGITVVPR